MSDGDGDSAPHSQSQAQLSLAGGSSAHTVLSSSSATPARAEIKFMVGEAAPLRLPPGSEGAKFNKRFDFKGTLKKPFAFSDGFEEIEELPDTVPDLEDSRVLPVPEQFANVRFEEERGKAWDDSFDIKSFNSNVRAKIPYVKWVPHILRGEEPPLRPLEAFSPREVVRDIGTWAKSQKETITYAHFEDTPLNSKALKVIGKLLAESFNLEVLILRNVGLKKLPKTKLLRHVKYLDISRNPACKDMKGLMGMMHRAPFMEVLSASDTGLAQNPKYRPSVLSTNATMTLRVVNNEPVGIDERVDAIFRYGAKPLRGEVPAMRWDLTLSTLATVQDMRHDMLWRPELITQIVLPDARLSLFHVGQCVNLVHFDVSNNELRSIRGMGLEHCAKIEYLSLKDNQLGRDELKVLIFMSSLKVLLISGNKPLGPPQDYRPSVLALTRHALGDNRSPGLVQLDDSPVTPEERVAAIAKVDSKANIDKLRWRFNLITYYGHRQMRTPEYLSRVTVLGLPRSNLSVVDLSTMHSLEKVDLSNNNLRTVDGLEILTRLKIINLFGNKPLDMKVTIPKLLKTNGLSQVSFGMEDKGHPRFAGSDKYRAKVLKDLVFNNPNLRFLDDKLITPLERVETLRNTGQDSQLIERYRFELIVNINCTMPWARRYHFTEVGIGNQYDPKDITVLRRLSDVGLTSIACDFGKFINLEELNLSGNKLANIRELNLHKLKKLRVLDVTNNEISTPLPDLAADIDNLKSLEVLAIRENPCMKNFMMARMKLIGYMQRMREVECTLEVIDFGISLDERVDGWKAAGGKDQEVEIMRYKAIMFLRAPRSTPVNQLTELDLSLGGLSHVDLSAFLQLRVLLLAENRITSVKGLVGIEACKKLRVLDLRRNEIANLKEVPDIILSLPKLENIGLAGNKCMRGAGIREKLIGMIPDLSQRRCALRAIDGREIAVSEIAQHLKNASSPDASWPVVLFRKLPKGLDDDSVKTRAQVEELDLRECELSLTTVTLHGFSGLTKLSLRGNQLKKLDGTGVDTCLELRELDVSFNKIKDLRDVTAAVSNLRNLVGVWCEGNPAWSTGKQLDEFNPDGRIKFCMEVGRLHEPGAKLRLLNGYKISIAERSMAVQRLKLYDSAGLDKFRLDLLAEERKRDGKDVFIDTSPILDLSNLGLASLSMVRDRVRKNMPNVQFLNLRGNQISNFDDLKSLLDVCFKLTALDIRDNQIKGTMKQLLRFLKTCPGLRLLWVDKSLKKTMKPPQKYSIKVFAALPVLSEVDDIVHPHRQRVQFRFEEAVAVAGQVDASSSEDELPGYHEVAEADSKAKKPKPKEKEADPLPDRWGDAPGSREQKKPKKDDTVPDRWGDSSSSKKKLSAKKADGKVKDRWASASGSESESDEIPDFDDGPTDLFGGIDDSYLPKDYKQTIGRNYDLGNLLTQLRDSDASDSSRTGTARGGDWDVTPPDSSSSDELPDYDDVAEPPKAKGRWD